MATERPTKPSIPSETAGTTTARARATALVRARHRFWALTVVAALATGSLSAALRAPTGTLTGVRIVLSGTVALITLTLAARLMIALERARRRER